MAKLRYPGPEKSALAYLPEHLRNHPTHFVANGIKRYNYR